MTDMIFDDARRILLAMLFVLAFGWMAAEVVPGADESAQGGQVAATAAWLPRAHG